MCMSILILSKLTIISINTFLNSSYQWCFTNILNWEKKINSWTESIIWTLGSNNFSRFFYKFCCLKLISKTGLMLMHYIFLTSTGRARVRLEVGKLWPAGQIWPQGQNMRHSRYFLAKSILCEKYKDKGFALKTYN